MAHTFTVTITDDEYKAFILQVPDADAWVDHAVRNKVRKCMIRMTEETVAEPDKYLSPEDQAELSQLLASSGEALKSPKHWSSSTKAEVIRKTTMKTRVERDEDNDMRPPRG